MGKEREKGEGDREEEKKRTKVTCNFLSLPHSLFPRANW